MKKMIAILVALLSLCLSLAACKTNTTEQPATSAPVAGVQQSNGQVTDTNGVIGDADDRIVTKQNENDRDNGNMLSDAASAVESTAEGIRDGAASAAENIRDGVQSTAENIRDGAASAADNIRDGVESTADNIREDAESAVEDFRDGPEKADGEVDPSVDTPDPSAN